MINNSQTKPYRILVINPGSNSTKIAVFENEDNVEQFSIRHDPEIIGAFSSAVYDQYHYRLQCVRDELRRHDINIASFDAIAGRGGFFTTGAKSGTYEVTEEMVEHLRRPTSEHVANLGGIIAKELADEIGVKAYVTDPVCVDEMSDLARVSGFAAFERKPKWQPLSHKATGRKLASLLGRRYEECNLIIGHLGGGITIGAHDHGRVVDVNNGLDGDGPFSVDRPGQVPIRDLISFCFQKGMTKEEAIKTFISKGGLYSYFKTVDTQAVEKKALDGDKRAALILDAMAYNIAKEIGSDATVLNGEVDAIGLTGGLANSKYLTSRIKERVSFIAPVFLFPGESEMEALALGALKCLRGEEKALIFEGTPLTFTTFDEIEDYIRKSRRVKKIALCGSHDEPALKSVVKARRRGFAEAILIGKAAETEAILMNLGEDPARYTIIDEPDEAKAAAYAVACVREGRADIPMKGLMQTASYMRAILNKETGILKKGALLSETTVCEYAAKNRFLFVTDCGINIEPDLKAKVGIINNAVTLAQALGIAEPKVACLSALENVNPKIKSTEDASELAHLEWTGCVVEGPFALDNAIDEEAAEHKGISGKVAGKADILLVPDLISGNILHKSLHFFGGGMLAGVVCGTDYPVVLTSRTDEPDTKYRSILLAVLLSIQKKKTGKK